MHKRNAGPIPGGHFPSHSQGPIGRAVGRAFEWLATAFGIVVFSIVVLAGVGFGGYLLVTEWLPIAASSVADIANAVFSFVTGFVWPAPRDLIGDAIAGALVGLAVGALRFRRRKNTEVYERIAEVFGEPKLATIAYGRVMIVGFHITAGLLAGGILAWLGIPSPGTSEQIVMTGIAHATPVFVLIAGAGAGGFGPPLDFLTILWFVVVIILLAAITVGISCGLVSYVAHATSGAIFAVSRVTAMIWAGSMSTRIGNYRGVAVAPIGHKVAANYYEAGLMENRDQLLWNLRVAAVDAPIYGAFTGVIVATILTILRLIGWLAT